MEYRILALDTPTTAKLCQEFGEDELELAPSDENDETTSKDNLLYDVVIKPHAWRAFTMHSIDSYIVMYLNRPSGHVRFIVFSCHAYRTITIS